MRARTAGCRLRGRRSVIGDEVRLPDNLPADLVSRRPDIVAARWRVDAMTHDVKEAKAEFYPDINLSAAIGLDAFGFGRFLTAASRTASAGPAIHLADLRRRRIARAIEGPLRRLRLRGRDLQPDARDGAERSRIATGQCALDRCTACRCTGGTGRRAQADETRARLQYKAGLTNQLTVLNADVNALSADQAVCESAR